jgi:hypothetical protein
MSSTRKRRTFLDDEYILKVKWDSNPIGEELDLHVEACDDVEVINKRSIWLRDTLMKVYQTEFQKHVLITMGNAIDVDERIQILKDVFHHLFETKTASIRSFTRGFKFRHLQIVLTMEPRKDDAEKTTIERLNYQIKRMGALPSMFMED